MIHAHTTQFRRTRGLNVDEEHSRIWLATLGGLIVPLPNFRWRREILAQHDFHHIITGFELTLFGELSLAAWELGVRCYTSAWARLLCGGLTLIGLIVQPVATLKAYYCGRQFSACYGQLSLMSREDNLIKEFDIYADT
jgi:hypothetical protein